ncbi:MAG: NADP-dependent malic enzyme [Candidatus Aenigmarchaeota archaeon]|nr:NADP-dependent malic enzyme [Candidatus Aenigmarchaeota archaeon]
MADDDALDLHRRLRGKIEIHSKIQVTDRKTLSLVYTPGVAAVSTAIAEAPEKAYDYTMKGNAVAIVTDGSAVLGLGNIGAEAALPVMEGKALIFKAFAGIDAIPLCFKDQNPREIIDAVKNIAPGFGGINLEDIKAPECFDIEAALQGIGIPVMHDDQHGTAIVILAGLINAAKVVGKRLEDLRIVVNGSGAAGTAVAKLLSCVGYDRRICTSVKEIIVLDSKGIIHRKRPDLNPYKRELVGFTNPAGVQGGLEDALCGADVFIGVSTGKVLPAASIRRMAKQPIVFAMANPTPEIMPDLARNAGAAVVGTGRSDFPNQVNNALVFPGIFRGALDARATVINSEMKLAAAYALAKCVPHPTAEKILPEIFDKSIVLRIAAAVAQAATETGVAGRLVAAS